MGRPAQQPPSDRPMQASPVRKWQNAVSKPLLIRRLVRPVGAMLAISGRVCLNYTCRGPPRSTAAVGTSAPGLSGAQMAERSFKAIGYS
eukprot:scaffold35944_cov44-Phaeocystis_antarctica.AAC.2